MTQAAEKNPNPVCQIHLPGVKKGSMEKAQGKDIKTRSTFNLSGKTSIYNTINTFNLFEMPEE